MRKPLPPSTTLRSEELRFALVMNGGVSLAVWMGGVSLELNRLVRETHPVYRGLLELTQTKARVDVISGTSAGGVNGAALALAQVYDRSLYALRDVWMERGAFGALLRDPARVNPPSLLDGDGYYLPALEEAFAALTSEQEWRIAPAILPINLTLTATMLRGERKHTVDDLGAVIEDAIHRTAFTFVRTPARGQEEGCDAFAAPAQIAVLARAARTTSSFPIAFEPVFWTPEDFRGLPGITPAVATPRYLVDGGLVDNKPFEAALDAIFQMPGRGNVRRVLAYIAPDPSVSAAISDDDGAKPPAMAEVASRSLVGIPSSESITDQIERIRQHNHSVHRRRDALVGLARLRTPAEIMALAQQLFPVYRYRRIHGLIDLFGQQLEAVAGVAAVAIAGAALDQTQIGRRTIAWMRSVLEQDDRWTHERVPQAWEALPATLTAAAPNWQWGLYTVEFLSEFMFDVLRRVQRLRHLMPGPHDPAPNLSAWEPAPARSWEQWDDRKTWARTEGPVAARDRPSDELLGPLWDRAFAIAGDLAATQSRDRHRVRRWAGSMVLRLINEPTNARDEEALAQRARITAAAVLHFNQRRDTRAQWNVLAAKVGELLADLAGPIAQIAAGIEIRPQLSRAEREFWLELKALAAALTLSQRSPEAIVRSALCFEVAHYAMSHRERSANVPVELVQISGNSKSPLCAERLAAKKLAGMQLAHFGAFYKRSWRANDWLMGRLDGVERLLPVALNPDRLYRLYGGHTWNNDAPSVYVAQLIRAMAFAGAAADIDRYLTQHADLEALPGELAYLDQVGSRVPETLPRCCELLTMRLHLEIVHAEMPLLARAARDDETAGANAQGVASQLANQVIARAPAAAAAQDLTLEHALDLFRQKRVGAERLRDEVGSDLFTKTVAQTIAVTHAAAVGEGGGLMLSMRAFLGALGIPILLFHWLAGRLIGASRTSAAIGAAALAVAITLLVLAIALPPKALDTVDNLVKFSWMLLGVSLLILMLRGLKTAIALAIAVAAPLALHQLGQPIWALAVGTIEVLVVWLYFRARGVRGLGTVLVILALALVTFPDQTTQDALAAAVCLVKAPLFDWLGIAQGRFPLLPPCASPQAFVPTLPILLAFLLFFATAAGFVRGVTRRALASWIRRHFS